MIKFLKLQRTLLNKVKFEKTFANGDIYVWLWFYRNMNNKETIEHRRHWINIYKTSNGCEICGYNKHPAALCFDHVKPEEKHEMTKNGCSKRNHDKDWASSHRDENGHAGSWRYCIEKNSV